MDTTTRPALRTHVSLDTGDLARALEFYRALLGQEPGVLRGDYARFTSDGPALVLGLNAVARPRSGRSALEHLGIAFEDSAGLQRALARLAAAGVALEHEHDVVCCYGRLERAWATDPDGVRWELFVPREEIVDAPSRSTTGGACCASTCCEE